MSSTLLTALSSPLTVLANTSPFDLAQVPEKVETIWREAWSSRPRKEGEGEKDRDVETARAVLEVVSRDLIVSPLSDGTLLEPPQSSLVEEKQAFQEALQYRLDIALSLFESAHASLDRATLLEPGAMFLPLLEDLVELVSVESWRQLWGYVETGSKRFTKDMPASKGKALPLLRTINAFLRFLPRTPEDLVFRGRVHQFASSVISIADKSAINMRGDYNEIKTVWDEEEKEEEKVAELPAAAVTEADGDVKMDEDTKPDAKAEESKDDSDTADKESQAETEFYPTLWSLQQYFAHPPSLAPQPGASTAAGTPTPFASFKQKSDFVLPILFEQTKKQKELMGREIESAGQVGSKKRKRNGEQEGAGFFHPRYLTGERLLEHELADPSFRRQILVQYFILFQFLLHLTPATASKQAFMGGMPKNFVIEAEDESWVKGKVSEIREELRKMPCDGVRFEKTVLSIITREFHYATWKNEGCPEGVFEIPPLDKGSAEERAQLWKRRLAPPRRFRFAVGTMSLSDMWRGGYTDIDQLRNWKRKSDVPSLYKEIEAIDADEEDDKAMGDVPADKLSQNEDRRTSLTWRALRLRTQTDIRQLMALKEKRDLHILFKPPPPKPEPTTDLTPTKDEVADTDIKPDVEVAVDGSPKVEEQQEDEVIADVAQSDKAAAEAEAEAAEEQKAVAEGTANDNDDDAAPKEPEPTVKTPELVETDLPTEITADAEAEAGADTAVDAEGERAEADSMDVDRPAEAPATPELEPQPEPTVETPALEDGADSAKGIAQE